MKKILLITLIFILQSIPSFGNPLNGKGLVCTPSIISEEGDFFIVGFHFENGYMDEYFFRPYKDVYVIHSYRLNYETDEKSIGFYSGYKSGGDYKGYFKWGYHYIDRETLGLYKEDLQTHQCNVFVNKTQFNLEMNTLREGLQHTYNEGMKGNKI